MEEQIKCRKCGKNMGYNKKTKFTIIKGSKEVEYFAPAHTCKCGEQIICEEDAKEYFDAVDKAYDKLKEMEE